MKIGTFKFVDDHTGCKHQFIVGPQRIVNHFHLGWCDSCRREVAIELDESDENKRTGRSWLVEYGPITESV
jgi:hypothetical protein